MAKQLIADKNLAGSGTKSTEMCNLKKNGQSEKARRQQSEPSSVEIRRKEK
jgi:hypothetical protein